MGWSYFIVCMYEILSNKEHFNTKKYIEEGFHPISGDVHEEH